MTTPDTDTLAGLLADATPGPWEWAAVYRNDVHDLVHWVSGETFPSGDPRYIQVHSDGSAGGEYGPDIDVAGADARLIALAPSLAAETIALRAQAARIERLEAVLREIARQKRTDELETEYDVEVADFEGGYDACIDRARAALEDEE